MKIYAKPLCKAISSNSAVIFSFGTKVIKFPWLATASTHTS